MTTLLSNFRNITRFDDPTLRLSYALLIVWLLTMIALPIGRWVMGDTIIPYGITLAAILQAAAVFSMILPQWGWRRSLQTLGIIAVLTWGAEFVGHRTGLPFGAYHYTDLLQPQVGGVPLLIPLAWFMLLPSSWVMAQFIVGKGGGMGQRALFVAVSAAALTAWDLFLDPQMVGWGFWVWENPSGYFGIPWSNYVGWLLVSGLATAAVNPPPLKPIPLALVYGIVWFLQTIGQAVFWGQVGPAVVGGLAMGGIMLLAYWRSRRRVG